MESSKKHSQQEAFPLNERATDKLQNDAKFKAYVQWAINNGAIFDKVLFPAGFGSDVSNPLIGSACKEDIEPNEAFIYIPNKLLINVERARTSEIGEIFDNHESLFKNSEDRDFLTLLMFMLYEHQKGEGSFWHPYFQAVDPGTLPCYWPETTLSQLDDADLVAELKDYKDKVESDWGVVLKLLKIYSPQHFDLEKCTYELYLRCTCFIATRCFGWGLPSTLVAPIADSFNHSSRSSAAVDIVNKRLHLMQNKIYTYSYDFEADADKGDDIYDKETSKLKYNIKRLFKEDQQVQNNPEYQTLIEGEKFTPLPNHYHESEVFTRFKNLMQSELDNPDEFESEETKKERFPEHGLELWGIGYVTSDHSEDEDEGDKEEEEDYAYNEDLRRKILSYATSGGQVEFDMEEFEAISSNTRLREIYQYRWWSDNDTDSYFVMINRSGKTLKKGEQIFYNYGRRNNFYLFQNYGFVLDESNQFNSLHFRVIVGTNPKLAINHVNEFLPDQKVMEDKENLETQTEIMKLQSYRVSETLMNYLRSVLQSNYTGPDQEYLMISTPRLIDYEIIVLDFAIDLLQHFGKEVLYKRSTLAEDEERAKAVVDYRASTILRYNIERKKIHQRHVNLLRVQRVILDRIQSQQSFSRACFKRVAGVEDFDSDYEVFKRRMGLRHYFKELKMNTQRIQKSKEQKSGVRNQEKKAKKKAKEETKTVAKENGASPNEKEKKPKTQAAPQRSASKGPAQSKTTPAAASSVKKKVVVAKK